VSSPEGTGRRRGSGLAAAPAVPASPALSAPAVATPANGASTHRIVVSTSAPEDECP